MTQMADHKKLANLEEGEDNWALEFALLESKTSVHDSFDVQDDRALSDECLQARVKTPTITRDKTQKN